MRFKFFLLSLLTLFITIALLPTALSTQWGHQRISELLKSQTNLSVEIKELDLNWFGTQEAKGIKLYDEHGNTPISIETFSTKKSLVLLLLQAPNLESFHMTGLQVTPSNPTALSLIDLLTSKTKLPKETSKILSEELIHLFGPQAQLHVDAQWNLKHNEGSALLNIKGESGNLSFAGEVQNDTLTLKKELTAEFSITPEFKKSLVAKKFSLIQEIAKTEQPIKITIDSKGFSLPLHEINPLNVHCEKITLDAGVLQFNSNGQLGDIFSILQKKLDNVFSIWCTPLYMSLKNGILKFERMDFLLMNQFPLAFWGESNLINEQTKIVLGFTPQTLNKAFRLANLPADYMLQMPIEGKKGHLSLDKTKFLTQITPSLPENIGGKGTTGRILKTVLSIANENLVEPLKQAPPPAQTTSPLPWENSKK